MAVAMAGLDRRSSHGQVVSELLQQGANPSHVQQVTRVSSALNASLCCCALFDGRNIASRTGIAA
eukprot:75730-Rhodomonas_salina.2